MIKVFIVIYFCFKCSCVFRFFGYGIVCEFDILVGNLKLNMDKCKLNWSRDELEVLVNIK